MADHPPANGEIKTLTRLQALWPVMVAIVIVVWTISSQLSDIASLRKGQDESSSERAQMAHDITLLKASQEEVETQFKALDDERNIQFSDQQRIDSMLWNSSPLGKAAPYPSAPFFQPNISKHGMGQ